MKLVSDGTVKGTHVYDDSGNKIENITNIFYNVTQWKTELTITVCNVKIDAEIVDRNVVTKEI